MIYPEPSKQPFLELRTHKHKSMDLTLLFPSAASAFWDPIISTLMIFGEPMIIS